MCHTGPAPDTDFNPRPPRGGRRGLSATNIRYTAISIHAPREGGDFYMAALLTSLGISIHAPREGGDVCDFANSLKVSAISIHAPREGGDGGINYPPPYKEDFNPRPPRGGATICEDCFLEPTYNFNPRPPRGGRP